MRYTTVMQPSYNCAICANMVRRHFVPRHFVPGHILSRDNMSRLKSVLKAVVGVHRRDILYWIIDRAKILETEFTKGIPWMSENSHVFSDGSVVGQE